MPEPSPITEPAPEPAAEPVADMPPPPRREREPGEEAGDTAIILLELMAATAGDRILGGRRLRMQLHRRRE